MGHTDSPIRGFPFLPLEDTGNEKSGKSATALGGKSQRTSSRTEGELISTTQGRAEGGEYRREEKHLKIIGRERQVSEDSNRRIIARVCGESGKRRDCARERGAARAYTHERRDEEDLHRKANRNKNGRKEAKTKRRKDSTLHVEVSR